MMLIEVFPDHYYNLDCAYKIIRSSYEEKGIGAESLAVYFPVKDDSWREVVRIFSSDDEEQKANYELVNNYLKSNRTRG